MITDKMILSGCLIVNERKELLLLYRPDRKHFETPGGKINADECKDISKPTRSELASAALRELHEELGNDFKHTPLSYFGNREFVTRDGRAAVAHKFVTKIISGTPIVNEPKIFSELKLIPIMKLDEYFLSPDLVLLLPEIRMCIASSKFSTMTLQELSPRKGQPPTTLVGNLSKIEF